MLRSERAGWITCAFTSALTIIQCYQDDGRPIVVVVVVLLFYVHGKHLRLCRDGQLT